MKRVFLDTVGMLALWDRRDQWHKAATKAAAIHLIEGVEMLTTRYVLLECANASARRPYRAEVVQLRDELEPVGLIIDPTDDDWDRAWKAYAQGQADSAGIVDHVSFVVMQRLGLTEAFTNDRHFRAAGFVTLF